MTHGSKHFSLIHALVLGQSESTVHSGTGIFAKQKKKDCNVVYETATTEAALRTNVYNSC